MSQQYFAPNQYPPQQAQQFVPQTAINELDSFMSGLTEEDRNAIFATPDFSGRYGDYLNRFMFYLLQGDIGTKYVNSSTQRREMAEQLKLIAQNIYASNKKATVSELERLQKENEALRKQMTKKGGATNAAE